ncbi:MAG TPA: hypothetical protein VL970_10985 [Candidatus Acidoferrales bacterium]|nr:hypothetical protein [Candidatus Acidoferrales bacterium]
MIKTCFAAALVLGSLPGGVVKLAAAEGTEAVRAADFLNSIGVNSAIDRRGESLAKTAECAKYLGIRWFRSGIEDCRDVRAYIDLHRQTGVRFSWSPGSGGSDLPRLLATARDLAAADALLAFEGPNEPNNWGVTYQGEKGGGQEPSWLAVAKLQAALYQAVKSDPELRKYPVWSITEGGAEKDNVGLQFLTIPSGAGTLLSAGTGFADAANVHNYVYHPNAAGLEDNKTWQAADPGPACRVDGLFGEYGRTWARHYAGYTPDRLAKLPRVTTETGVLIEGAITEDVQALNLLSLYLDQFKRGWSHTAVYLLRDRVDEAGNQKFGFYAPDYTPRKAATYLHNLTTILADSGSGTAAGSLLYSVEPEPSTVHDLLLQKADGTFELAVWDERLTGTNQVTIRLGTPVATAEVYDPTLGTSAVARQSQADALSLTLSNHPLIVALATKEPGGP